MDNLSALNDAILGNLPAGLDLLRLHEEIDDRSELSLTLLGFAAVAHRRGDGRRSAVLCGAADSILRSSGVALPPAVKAFYEREVGYVLELVDAEAFAEAFAEGQQMTITEAIAFARAGMSAG